MFCDWRRGPELAVGGGPQSSFAAESADNRVEEREDEQASGSASGRASGRASGKGIGERKRTAGVGLKAFCVALSFANASSLQGGG